MWMDGINLEYFRDPKQKAELFLLKADLLSSRMSYYEGTRQAFGTCIVLSDNYGKGMVCSGHFLQSIHIHSITTITLSLSLILTN
jgi:hypothetical protein